MKRLLDILRQNARTPLAEIADRLGKTPREVEKMIGQLERRGAIRGYRAVVDLERAPGSVPVLGIIEVVVKPQRDVGFDAVARRICRHRQVKSAHLISGRADLVLHVEGRTLRDVADFVAEKLATIDGVDATTTHFLLRTYKEDGIMIHGEDGETDRLPVTP